MRNAPSWGSQEARERFPLEGMPEGHQGEFVFVDGWTPPSGEAGLPPSLDDEIAAAWRVPIGRRVRVALSGHDLPAAEGLLEVAEAPAFPFDARRALRLRIRHVEFTNRQIESWVLI
jgi:hypothetical protein